MVDWANVSGIALNIGIIIISIVVAGGLLLLALFLYFKWKRYREYSCIIWEKDGFGQMKQTSDRAGIFVDGRTKNKRLFLKNANVGLDPNNVPYVQQGGSKFIYLLRTGLKNFQYIRPVIGNPAITLTVGEEDVNWAVNAYERQKRLFAQNIFMQYLPFIALAFVSIIILVIFIYFFKEFSTLKALGSSMSEAAKAIAQAQGTTIIE